MASRPEQTTPEVGVAKEEQMKQNCLISRLEEPNIAHLYVIEWDQNLINNIRVLCTRNPETLKYFVPEELFWKLKNGETVSMAAECYDEYGTWLFEVDPLKVLSEQVGVEDGEAEHERDEGEQASGGELRQDGLRVGDRRREERLERAVVALAREETHREERGRQRRGERERRAEELGERRRAALGLAQREGEEQPDERRARGEDAPRRGRAERDAAFLAEEDGGGGGHCDGVEGLKG